MSTFPSGLADRSLGKGLEDVEASLASTVQLRLQSRPESVAIVRAMLAGASELLDFGAERLADLKTAVSEACNNVVIHAYGGQVGPLEVRLVATDERVQVTVSDQGTGIAGSALAGEPAGVGIPVIRALSADTRFRSRPEGGTQVQMLFAESGGEEDWQPPGPVDLTAGGAAPQGDIVITVSPVSLLSGILGRIAGCVAAEAHFSIDRYADLYLVSDGVAAHARHHASGAGISAALAARPREVDLAVGPLLLGSAGTLKPLNPGPAMPLLSLLVNETRVESASGSETLMLMLADRQEAG